MASGVFVCVVFENENENALSRIESVGAEINICTKPKRVAMHVCLSVFLYLFIIVVIVTNEVQSWCSLSGVWG